jgi:hypothetical protein
MKGVVAAKSGDGDKTGWAQLAAQRVPQSDLFEAPGVPGVQVMVATVETVLAQSAAKAGGWFGHRKA